MDKKDKFKNFMKKEGLYVILVVCLCLVATVAAVTAKKSVEPSKQSAEEKKVADNNNNSVIEFDNAELVKDEEKEKDKANTTDDKKDKKDIKDKVNTSEKDKPTKEETSKDKNSVQTSATPKKEFISPIKEGKISRTYNIKPRIDEEGKTASVFKGVDIETVEGADVRAISDGKVIDASKGDSKDGYFVKIEHSNGIVSMYGNLTSELKVKAGDKVTQGTVLGKVGKSVKNNPEDRVSENYLLFHMEKSKKPVDPQKYLTDTPVKK